MDNAKALKIGLAAGIAVSIMQCLTHGDSFLELIPFYERGGRFRFDFGNLYNLASIVVLGVFVYYISKSRMPILQLWGDIIRAAFHWARSVLSLPVILLAGAFFAGGLLVSVVEPTLHRVSTPVAKTFVLMTNLLAFYFIAKVWGAARSYSQSNSNSGFPQLP